MSDAKPQVAGEEKSHEQLAAELQGLAEMAALEARLARAVARLGGRLFVGMTTRDAYKEMAVCLELGAEYRDQAMRLAVQPVQLATGNDSPKGKRTRAK